MVDTPRMYVSGGVALFRKPLTKTVGGELNGFSNVITVDVLTTGVVINLTKTSKRLRDIFF